MIEYLKQRPLVNVAILITYYLSVVLPHEVFGLAINKFFKRFDLGTYNRIILIVCFSFLLVTAIVLWKKMIRHEERNKLLFFFLVTIFSMTIVTKYLFVINIEAIHYLQYCIFAILCYPLTQNLYTTLIWSTLAGALDEGYQYFYLSPERTDYYDFNDVITNLLGAAFGLLVLKTWGYVSLRKSKAYYQRFLVVPVTVIVVLLAILIATSLLSVFPSDDVYNLVKVVPEGFWSKIPRSGDFHIVMPFEGMVVIILYLGIYFQVFKK